MKISPSTFLHAATALAFAALSGQAAAVDTCTTMSDNGVSVQECSTGSKSGTYNVTNNNDQSIEFFVVSTRAPSSAVASTTRADWFGSYYSQADWDKYFTANFGGTFDKVFGDEDTGVFFFGRGQRGAVIAKGETTGAVFSFDAEVSSHFIAGNSSGVFAQSFGAAPPVAVIPEPGTYALMGLGLLGLGAAVRRQRKAS